MEPVAVVRAGRSEPRDDHWGGSRAFIELLAPFDADSIAGLETFSHLEVLFHFHRVQPTRIERGARHPRNNADWPAVGIFAQRGKNRPNRLGSSVVRIVSVQGTTIEVAELDAIDGTPVIDLKPVMHDFLPRETVQEPAWCAELMREYWATGDGPDSP